MNLLASFEWLREYVKLDVPVEDVAKRLSLSGPGVERLHPAADPFRYMVVGRITKITPHPDADALRLCAVDIGTRVISVVCGGKNIAEQQYVAVALPGARVKWHGQGDLVEITVNKVRGVESMGMICAAEEIGLFDAFPSHGEKDILDLGIWFPEEETPAGRDLADLLGVKHDTVMDVEVTTNRPDAMGMVGLAREISVVMNTDLIWKPTDMVALLKKRSVEKPDRLIIDIKTPHVKRYQAVFIRGVKNGHSPWWLKSRLLSAGLRPINTVTDITNFVLLELGQPLHAFDAKRLEGKLMVRPAKKEEKISALDGKTYTLTPEMTVIADENGPVAIGGVMGGEHSSVTSDTTDLLLESATFDPVNIRKTARALGINSEAQLRFEKGLSTEATSDALHRAIELILQLCGGEIASEILDERSTIYKPLNVSLPLSDFERFIGVAITEADIERILTALGFSVTITKKMVSAVVPWWRDGDIEHGRDLVEEVARVYGYANIPPIFPMGLAHTSIDPHILTEDRLRTFSQGAGLTECLSYSFISHDTAQRAGFDPIRMPTLQNPLTSDFVYMRTSLIPSLLEILRENQEQTDAISLFEIGHIYLAEKQTKKEPTLPEEIPMFAAAFLGKEDTTWKKAKGFVEAFAKIGFLPTLEWRALTEDPLWHPGRSAQAFINGTYVATIGELHPRIAERYGFVGRVGLVEMPIHPLTKYQGSPHYTPLPTFPSVKRDLALIVDRTHLAATLTEGMKEHSDLLTEVQWFDTYRGKGLPAGKKSVAFHLIFSAKDRTLTTEEVEHAIQTIIAYLQTTFSAEIRG